MNIQQYQKILLLIVGIGLIPIALFYGVAPEKTLYLVYGFTVENVNQIHIFRGIMGLYIGQLSLWLFGAFYPVLRRPALYSLVFFMLGIAIGRILSILIDGIPHWTLIAYLLLEIAFGFIGFILLKKEITS